MLDAIYAVGSAMAEHWTVWLVTIVLILAAVIDGFELKVPNWITFPFIISGWIYSVAAFGWEGLGWSLVGTVVGLALLLPAYSIGGMGAGDVKLLAGVGAWMYGTHTFYAFCASAVVGALCAVIMVLAKRAWKKHSDQFWLILNEIMVIGNPEKLAVIAAKRKPSMLLLPYGIPIAIGTIGYFLVRGMLV
ncbi:peptidase A24A prepilin type IV [Pirellula staleyi DSM 6068]|uniref:Peptidase A24A prepilin type IV n=1 Tax=Pirellula staleyi (strain ATCC 27377 / DSM 6068 / ICPB 4128) TaxID=530564 RepID=D2R1M8_PIRSD|nr:A24 family peptidase [Pirellula staleyi]ADB16747.1 peptidase A24A prepilin type IV [Pirellula staleyi DSM 6068]